MISNRPYLIRAINEWLLDSQCTPHCWSMLKPPVSTCPGAQSGGQDCPEYRAAGGEGLRISNEEVTFLARFQRRVPVDFIAVSAVLAIYAKENGRGMMFNEADEPEPDDSGPARPHRAHHLKS